MEAAGGVGPEVEFLERRKDAISLNQQNEREGEDRIHGGKNYCKQ